MNMKKLIVFCLACISFTGSHAQEYFRYLNGEKHYFEISSNKVILKVNEKMTEDAIGRSFRENASLHVSDISATAHQEYKLANIHCQEAFPINLIYNSLSFNFKTLII